MNIVYHDKQNEVLPRADLTDTQYELATKIAVNWHRSVETILETASYAKKVEDLPFREKKKVKAYLKEYAKMSPSILTRLISADKSCS